MKPVYFLVLLLLVSVNLHADTTYGFEANAYVKGDTTLNYRVLYPPDFDPQKTYPLVLFLHGSGERGDDNLAQLTHGAELFAREDVRREYPAIVVFPQAPRDDYWANVDVLRESQPYQLEFADISAPPTDAMQMVLALMDELSAEPFVDSNKIYVGGLSMGGMGTYEILARRPQMFAAAIAICGGSNPENAKQYRQGLPLWAFHGEQDQVVDVGLSEQMVAAINEQGGHARLTLYKDTGHNSWDSAFADPELLPWLFSHQLQD